MYTYSVFSVKEDVATHYFYKAEIIYRFLKAYDEGPAYKYLQLQYNYVIEPLDVHNIGNYLHSINRDLQIERCHEYLKIYWNDKSLAIYKNSRHVNITCASIEEAEEFSFPALRHSAAHFFVINNNLEDYGWLSIKKNPLQSNQLLYSPQ